MPLNEATVVGLPPLSGMLKTVPSLYAPPNRAQPYNVLPSALNVKPASGFSPLLPLNEVSVVTVWPRATPTATNPTTKARTNSEIRNI